MLIDDIVAELYQLKKIKVSYADIAKIWGCSRENVSSLARNSRNIKKERIELIEIFYGVRIDIEKFDALNQKDIRYDDLEKRVVAIEELLIQHGIKK